MRAATASSPGHAGRANEDFVGTAPGVVVLLDGAGIPGTEDICRHGVAWYSHTLGATLLARMTPGTDPVTALADSIEHVAGLHRHTCDLANPSSPQATVAMVSFEAGRVDYLVLADAYVLLAPEDGPPQLVTDPREVDVRRECIESHRDRAAVVAAFRARRNQPGGYWIAKDDPEAAAQAVVGRVPSSDLGAVALLSNGASRIVDPYGLVDWPGVVDLLRSSGPDELLRQLRRAESETPDDATVAYCDLLA